MQYFLSLGTVMNKINPQTANINTISPIDPDIKLKKASQTGDGSFDRILAGQIDKGTNHSTPEKSTGLPEIEGAFKAQFLPRTFNQTRFTQKLDQSLNMLERYASWLGDPGKTLKQAHGLLEEILARTESLEQDFDENTAPNADLKEILTRLAATVAVEQIKINRGDYSG